MPIKKDESDLLKLNRALQEFQKGAKDIDDVEEQIAVKSAGKRVVEYVVKSTDRETSRERVEKALKAEFKTLMKRNNMPNKSSMEVTEVHAKDKTIYRFVYKPTKGGMSQTTLNSSITELYPCIAFEKGIRVSSVSKTEDGFTLQTNKGEIKSKYLVWAAGEFQYPKLHSFPGSKYCIHNSLISNWDDVQGNEFFVIGGYESGMDTAINLAERKKRVLIICLLYTSPSPRDLSTSRMPSSA